MLVHPTKTLHFPILDLLDQELTCWRRMMLLGNLGGCRGTQSERIPPSRVAHGSLWRHAKQNELFAQPQWGPGPSTNGSVPGGWWLP